MRSLLSLAPFVFSTELAKGEGAAAAILIPRAKGGLGVQLYLHEVKKKNFLLLVSESTSLIMTQLIHSSTLAQKGQSQISNPNTKQFPKTQIGLPKHKPISQNTNQFSKIQISLLKHKTNFVETQIKRLGTWALLLSESLERTHSQDFPHPTW